jgi:hypothetical protein
MIKRNLGSALRSRRPCALNREVLLRVITHNLMIIRRLFVFSTEQDRHVFARSTRPPSAGKLRRCQSPFFAYAHAQRGTENRDCHSLAVPAFRYHTGFGTMTEMQGGAERRRVLSRSTKPVSPYRPTVLVPVFSLGSSISSSML